MKQKQRICIDIDHVIANLIEPWLDSYNQTYKDNIKLGQIAMWDWHILTKCGLQVYDLLTPELFENLPVIPNSQEVIQELMEDYEVFIITAASNANIIPAKAKWMKEHFPFIHKSKIVYAVDKSICLADYLIDDKPENLESFKGEKLLFSATHNKQEKRFNRFNDWLDIRDYFIFKKV